MQNNKSINFEYEYQKNVREFNKKGKNFQELKKNFEEKKNNNQLPYLKKSH